MTNAPERMWVCTETVGSNHYPPEECPKEAGWTHVSSKPDGCATEYIRADLVAAKDARIAELEAEVERLQEAAVTLIDLTAENTKKRAPIYLREK